MDCRLGRAALVVVLVTAWSGVASATDDTARVNARNLAKAAKHDFDAGHFDDAQLKFERAYAMARVPTLALWTARVLVKRGKLVMASELYQQAARLTPNDLWIGKVQEQAQADAKTELQELQPRIPKLRIHVQGAAPGEVALTIDDVNVPGASMGLDLPADPGRHHAVGKTYAQTLELEIDLVEGESKDAFLKFNERAAAPALATGDSVPTTDRAAKSLLASGTAEGASATNLTTNLTTNPGSPEPAGGSQPVYAKWWFWTGVGAVVVAGTVTALLLAHRSGGACSGAIYTCTGVQ